MTGQQLRNSILQEAIQGKLVPQRSEDGRATDLIKKIREEKKKFEEKVKEKNKIKESVIFQKDGSFFEKIGKEEKCIDNEIPFNIPESWEWVRLKTICIVNPRNNADDNIEAGFIPMTLIKEGYMGGHEFENKKWGNIKNGFTHFANGDLVLAKITPCFQNRKSTIIENLPNNIGAGTTELHVLRNYPNSNLNLKYLLILVKTEYFISAGIKILKGTAGQQRISKSFVEECLVPLPPLAEQERIVAKIEELLPLVEEYGSTQQSLSILKSSFPKQLRKSILQEAIQGKLVPQRSEDGRATDLIKKIREEKKKLDEQVKRKKKIEESVIFRKDGSFFERIGAKEECIDDKIPFSIPESWEWVRLGNVTYSVGNKSNQIFTNQILKHNGKFPVVSQSQNIIDGYSNEEKKVIRDLPLVMFGDHTRNVKFINFEFIVGADGTKFHKVICGNPKYVYYWMLFTASNLKNRGYARHYALLKAIPIPLPPLAEQERIVAKIEELLPLVDSLLP